MLKIQVGCCGSDMWMDYTDANMILPLECRDPGTGNMYKMGCTETFMRWMEPLTGWLTGVALALCALQVFLKLYYNIQYVNLI